MSEINAGDFGFTLSTCGFRAFRPEMGVPVRTSNGKPRYHLNYPLMYKAECVFPRWALVKMSDMSRFSQLYQEDLDKLDFQIFVDTFEAIAQHNAGAQSVLDGMKPNLVLMCFEADVRQCHRGAFAQWWNAKTGMEVPELPRRR